MNKNKLVYLLFLLLLGAMSSCGTMKDSSLARFYHNTTARFNGYFNAKEKLKDVQMRMFNEQQDKYDRILPVFTEGDEASAKGYFTDLETIITKCTTVIKKHNMSKWVDDCYLLIGKAYFYKRDYFTALSTFDYVNSNYPKTMPGQEARLWTIRTLLDMDKLNEAQAHISAINQDKKFPSELKPELHKIEAQYFIQAKQYKDAAQKLEVVLSETKGKKNYKARYLFILGQLYQLMDMPDKAAKDYESVIRKNPNYDLAFQAKLGLSEVSNNTNEVRRYLARLIKDDKNISYFDQIYYTLAKIDMKEGKVQDAVVDLNKSLRSSKGNNSQKARSYLMLADIYFKQPNYPFAKAYYDSAANFVTKDFPDYENFKNRQLVLSDLVNNLITIQREDSLQKLAAMPREALDQKINEIAEQDRQKALQAQQQKQNNNSPNNGNMPDMGLNNGFNTNINTDNSGGSSNPFYNQAALAQGYADFINRWGNRPLADDWRRKNKPQVFNNNNNQQEAQNGEDTTNKQNAPQIDSSTLAKMPSLKDIPSEKQKYYIGIPFLPSQRNMSNASVQEALYNVGTIYDQKLNEEDKAIQNFQELIDRFPDGKYIIQANYNLYKIYMARKDTAKAAVYKNFILKNYPGSEYAMLIQNPDQLRAKFAKKDKNPELENLYASAYEAFNNSDCNTLQSKLAEANERFSKNYLQAKFEYLNVICHGRNDSTGRFIDSLASFIKKYPGDEITQQAISLKGILEQRELDKKKQEQQNKQQSSIGNNLLNPGQVVALPGGKIDSLPGVKPVENTSVSIPVVNYKADMNRPHHYVLVFPASANLEKVKVAYSNYNMEHYPGITLSIATLILDSAHQVLVVKNFPDKDQALRYYKDVELIPDFFKDLNLADHQEFIISDSNFPLFIKNKDTNGYLGYFKKNYL